MINNLSNTILTSQNHDLKLKLNNVISTIIIVNTNINRQIPKPDNPELNVSTSAIQYPTDIKVISNTSLFVPIEFIVAIIYLNQFISHKSLQLILDLYIFFCQKI